MHETYLIGASIGGAVAIGLLAAGLLPRAVAALAAGIVAAVLAWLLFGWPEAIGAAVGGLIGGAGAGAFAGGALRRGGTRGGTGVLFLVAAVIVFALALIPFVGFLEAVALVVLAARARSRAGEKFAGLRTLAK